ncbi:MAG TPA: hypothetical protein DCE80_14330 [Ignavibacteriales bacterium]|nr:hypothetical protein [Ignavibacteriales bacterium]
MRRIQIKDEKLTRTLNDFIKINSTISHYTFFKSTPLKTSRKLKTIIILLEKIIWDCIKKEYPNVKNVYFKTDNTIDIAV